MKNNSSTETPPTSEQTESKRQATVIVGNDDVIKFQSVEQANLFFWSEAASPDCFMAVAQVDGYPGTEAHDDWFRYERDANHIALCLAEGRNL